MSLRRINPTDPVALVVAWRVGAAPQGATVRISPAVQDQLRGIAVAVTGGLTAGHAYSPDTDMEDNTHLIAGRDQLLDVELLGILERGANLGEAGVQDLLERPLLCYAIVVGVEQPLIFVRKRSPVTLLRKSIIAQLLSGALNQIDPPLFAFDALVDVIIAGDEIFILNKRLFEALFKESEVVLSNIPVWVEQFTRGFPVTSTSRDILVEALRRNGFLRNKIHNILTRPYIDSLTPAQIEEKLTRYGFDTSVYMRDGEVDFTKATAPDLIRLLNEDFFVGDFSDEQYAAGSKRRVAPSA